MTPPRPDGDLSWIRTCSWDRYRERILKVDENTRFVLARERGAVDATVFIGQFLRTYMRLPFATFHLELMRWHHSLGGEAHGSRHGRRLALAAPRGSAKSTIASFFLVLHDIAYGREQYIVLISATERQAQQRLRALRGELREDSALRRAFGLPRAHATATSLVVGPVRIDAYGAASEMRGLAHEAWRPTKIILDDAESSASIHSPRRRQRLLDWFRDVVEHLGATYTHIIVVGTVLHAEGLLATLMKRPDFEARLHRSIEQFAPPTPLWEEWRRLLTDPCDPERRATARRFFEDHWDEMVRHTRVLWSRSEDIEHLTAMMLLQGRRAFFQEKQNEPLGPENALFDPDAAWRTRLVAREVLLIPPGRGGQPTKRLPLCEARRFGFLDSALGRSADTQRGDFAALAIVLLFPGALVVLAEMWVRRAPPSMQVEAILSRHEQQPFERLGVEGTGFQELLAQKLEACSRERLLPLPIEVVRPTRAKESRVAALEPLLASGRLALDEGLPEEFWRELAHYPRVDHDDALDATAGAVELALQAARRAKGEPLAVAERRRRTSSY